MTPILWQYYFTSKLGPDMMYEVKIRDGFDAFRVSWFQQVDHESNKYNDTKFTPTA